MVFEDVAAPVSTELTLVCAITGISQETPVTWIGPDDSEISGSDTTRYVIDQGNFIFFSKASTLTIKQSVIASLSPSSNFKCKVKSALYPTHSPAVVKEMTLVLLQLGKV